MKSDVIEVFDEISNVEFSELGFAPRYAEELPVFKIRNVPADEWNQKAFNINKKTFTEIFKREPKNDDEVLAWIRSITHKESPSLGTMDSRMSC